MGKRVSLQTPMGQLHSDVFLWAIGPSSTGKTKAYVGIGQRLINDLFASAGRNRFIQSFTSSTGLLKAMADGCSTVFADEIGHILQKHLLRKNEESFEFRRFLNSSFSGCSLTKNYASNRGYNIDETFLGMVGMTHPELAVETLLKMLDINDGLVERIMMVSASPYSEKRTDDGGNAEEGNGNDYYSRICMALQRLKTSLEEADKLCLKLSEDVVSAVNDLNAKIQSESDAEFKAIEDSLRTGQDNLDSETEEHTDCHDTKVLERALRLAIFLHVIVNVLEPTDGQQTDQSTIPETVSSETFQAAYYVSKAIRAQTDEFVNTCQDMIRRETRKRPSTSRDHSRNQRCLSLEQQILLSDGPIA